MHFHEFTRSDHTIALNTGGNAGGIVSIVTNILLHDLSRDAFEVVA